MADDKRRLLILNGDEMIGTKIKTDKKGKGIFECDKENCDLNKKIILKKENKES